MNTECECAKVDDFPRTLPAVDALREYGASVFLSKNHPAFERLQALAVIARENLKNHKELLRINPRCSGRYNEQFDEAERDLATKMRRAGVDTNGYSHPINNRKETMSEQKKPECACAEDQFVGAFNAIMESVHSTAKDKGWWDRERNNGELIALVHSELSEALEALRHDNPPDDKVPQFSGAEAELADAIIRIMDMSAARGWKVAEALVAKARMNQSRERMHGGKAF